MRPSGSTTTNGSGACQNNPAPPPTLSTPTAFGDALYHQSGGPGNFWTEEKGIVARSRATSSSLGGSAGGKSGGPSAGSANTPASSKLLKGTISWEAPPQRSI